MEIDNLSFLEYSQACKQRLRFAAFIQLSCSFWSPFGEGMRVSLLLIGRLYLISVWVGEDQRTNTINTYYVA